MTERATAIPGEAVQAMALRLLFLQTHYRKPLDFTMEKLTTCEKIWRRWVAKAESRPEEDNIVLLIEALCDDLNTPKAVACLHKYYKDKAYGTLFAGMAFLGLIPNANGVSLMDLTDLKMTPPEHDAMLEKIGLVAQ